MKIEILKSIGRTEVHQEFSKFLNNDENVIVHSSMFFDDINGKYTIIVCYYD